VGGGAAAAAAAMVRAVKASGAIVRVEPEEFLKLLSRNTQGLVVHAPGGWLNRGHRYLMAYKGLGFSTYTREPFPLPGTCEIVEAGSIWVPG
jgi:hypothetical protein